MKTKSDKTSLPARKTGNENKIRHQLQISYPLYEVFNSLELTELQQNGECVEESDNFYGIGGDDYYYREIEEGEL